MIDVLLGQVFRLILLAIGVVLVAQYIGVILSVLIAALVTLAVVRLFWPRPR